MGHQVSARMMVGGFVVLAVFWLGLARCAQRGGETGRTDATAASFTGPRLTVTTWNLDWFPGQRPNASELKRRAHVAAVAPVLARLEPDILCLQEVADAGAARLLADQLPGCKVDVCSEFPQPLGRPGSQQEVLCSRLPLLRAAWQRWQPGRNGAIPARGFAFAAYRLRSGGIALVYCLHLKSNRTDDSAGFADNLAQREEAMRQLLAEQAARRLEFARAGRVELTLVAGDMNTSLDDPRFGAETTLRELRAAGGFAWAWEGLPAGIRLTLPAEGRYPAVCFDHLFYRSERARLLGCSVEPTGRTASDHRPVTAVFGW